MRVVTRCSLIVLMMGLAAPVQASSPTATPGPAVAPRSTWDPVPAKPRHEPTSFEPRRDRSAPPPSYPPVHHHRPQAEAAPTELHVEPTLRLPAPPPVEPGRVRARAQAQAAYQAAERHLQADERGEAVAELDAACELDPGWGAPVRLRAETFAALSRRHGANTALLRAEAADRERLLVLEPGVEVEARRRELAELQARVAVTRQREQRRRGLTKPAVIVGTLSGSLMIGGALMFGMLPSADLATRGQRPNLYGAIAMLSAGVALAVPAITLAVLAGRQNRRDAAVAELDVHRRNPTLALAPQPLRGGGGVGLRLRF